MFKSLRYLHFALPLVALVLTGCVMIDPHVNVSKKARDAYEAKGGATMENALAYAQDLRTQYRDAIKTHSRFNASSGLFVAGTATAAAAAALNGVSNETLMRLGIGGASAYTVNGFLYSPARQRIYALGAESLSCGIALFEPLRPANFKNLRTKTLELKKETRRLDQKVEEAKHLFSLNKLPRQLTNSMQVLEDARATLAKATPAANAPATLVTFVNTVNDKVTTALLDTEPDVGSLMTSLGTSIPTNAMMLSGQAPQVPTGKEASLTDEHRRAVEIASAQATTVRNLINVVELELAGFAPADDSALKACSNLVQGGQFRVLPQPSVVINTSVPSPTADVIATGGTLPHSAVWLGQKPPSDLSITTHAETTRTRFELEPSKGASGIYQLLVSDSGGNSSAILINFVTAGTVDASLPKTPPEKNPVVSDIQTKFIKLGCMADKNPDGESNVDGIWGDITEAAFQVFVKVALSGETVEDSFTAETGTPEFYKEVQNQLKIAEDVNLKCTKPEEPAVSPDASNTATADKPTESVNQ